MQIVISGASDAIDKVIEIAKKEHRIKLAQKVDGGSVVAQHCCVISLLFVLSSS
jgi:hypothetical protein